MSGKQEKELIPLTESELFVRQSDENVELFDPQRITDALVRETNLASETAHKIAIEVKEQIRVSGIRALTAPLIRGLVDAKLLEHGLMNEYWLHSRLGVPIYDVDRIIQSVSGETAMLHRARRQQSGAGRSHQARVCDPKRIFGRRVERSPGGRSAHRESWRS